MGLRLQRFEVVAVIVASLIVGVSALIVRWRLDSVGVSAACWDEWFGTGPSNATPVCIAPVETFLGINEGEGGKVMAAMAILPLFAGVFLGVPVIAREIEGRTAPTVWALAASRPRWLAGRLLPLVVLLVVALGFLAIASELLWRSREPWGAIPRFGDVGLHGPSVIARGVGTFGFALLVGAVAGRTLPAVIAGVVLCLVLFVGWQTAFVAWGDIAAELRPTPPDLANYDAVFPGGMNMSEGYLNTDGRFLYDWEAVELAPAGADPYVWLSDPDNGWTRMMQGVPGTAYPRWALIETVGFGAIGLLGIALTFPVVERRRPQ
ncbi:MAG TPA: hypothetical protein VF119_03595 [Candidatus Limnocylindrales bacterium]